MFSVIDCCRVIIIPKTLKIIAVWAAFQKCEGWKWTVNWLKFWRPIRHLQSRLSDVLHCCKIPCLCSQTLKPTLDIAIECLLSTNQATPSLYPKILLLNLISFHFLPSLDMTGPHPASFVVGARVFASDKGAMVWSRPLNPCSVKVKIESSHTSVSPVCLCGKYRDNFNLLLYVTSFLTYWSSLDQNLLLDIS